MRKLIPHDPTSLNRRPTVVEAEPGATIVAIEIDSTRHRISPDEARAVARALLAGVLVADNRLDDQNLDFDDELPWAF